MGRSMRVGMVSTLLADGALLLCGILSGSLAARLLMPDGRGALAVSLFWPQLLAGVGLLSLHEAATYRMSVRPERGRAIAASAFWLALGLSGVTVLAGYLLLPVLLGDERSALVPLARTYLVAFVPFNFVSLTLLATDHSALRFVRYNVLRLATSATYLLGLLWLWAAAQTSVEWVLAANCAGTVLVAVVQLLIQPGRLLPWPSVADSTDLLTCAARFHPASILGFLAAQVDQFVVLTMWDDHALGIYVVAMAVASSVLAVAGGAVHRVLFPHLAQVQDHAKQAALLARSVRQTSLVLVALSLPIAIVLPWLVSVLFGAAFRESLGPAYVLLAGQPLAALKVILIQGARALGEGHAGSTGAAVSLATMLALAFPLGASFGLVGVTMALGLANLLAVLWMALYLCRRRRVSPREFWGLDRRTLGEILVTASRFSPLVSQAPR